MTVKEAIDELKYSREMCYFDPSTGETGKPYSDECERMAQALDIAIEALTHEPVGDCINRQALKQAMYHEAFEVDSDMQKWDGGCWIRYKLFEKIVDIMPSAQPEQKTAHWYSPCDYDPPEWCSNCHTRTRWAFDDGYCPKCGAKIEEGDERRSE